MWKVLFWPGIQPGKYEIYLQVLICRWQSVSCHQGEQPGILHWRCNPHVPHGHWSWRMNNHLWRRNCTCILGGSQGRQVQQSMLQKMISEMLSQQQVLATRGRPHFRGLALALPKEGIDYKLGIFRVEECSEEEADLCTSWGQCARSPEALNSTRRKKRQDWKGHRNN